MFFRLFLFFVFYLVTAPSPSFANSVPPYELRIYSSFSNVISVDALPIGEKTDVVFKLTDNKRLKSNIPTKVEIWEVSATEEKKKIIGAPTSVLPRMTTGELPSWSLYTVLQEEKPTTLYYKAFVDLESGEKVETPIIPLQYFDAKGLMAELNECSKRTNALQNTIPKKTLTGVECTEAGGHIESSMLLCPPPENEPLKDTICKDGIPLGSVSGLQCPCICCK